MGSSFHIFRLESLEAGNVHVGDQSVQAVGGVLILVAHTSKTNANTEWNVPEINSKLHNGIGRTTFQNWIYYGNEFNKTTQDVLDEA